jgi:DNA uptake protein ComE-like DNA-binding protein
MDRLAAYVHWNDNPSLDQAIMVARRQAVDWSALHEWARREGVGPEVIDKVKSRSAD